jgi:T4 bacteriophage base plate protein
MALPKIDVPTHQVTIPSTGKEITVRPFLVKEEKILLTAMQGEDTEDIANATKQIVANCILSKDVDVDKLEIFDFEYLILQLRIVSIGETTTIRFLPIEDTTCPECSKTREVQVNLKDAKVDGITESSKKIKVNEKIGIGLKYPTAKVFALLQVAKRKNDLDNIFKLVWSCVDYVYDEEKITSSKDVTLKEGIEFLENLSSETFKQIEAFLAGMPKLKQTVHIKCHACTFEQDYILSGLDDFFV